MKWKIQSGEYAVDDASMKFMQKMIDDTPELKDINRNKRLRRHLESYMQRFLGSLKLPIYNKLTQFNFYDTLESLLTRIFFESFSHNLEKKW